MLACLSAICTPAIVKAHSPRPISLMGICVPVVLRDSVPLTPYVEGYRLAPPGVFGGVWSTARCPVVGDGVFIVDRRDLSQTAVSVI